MKLPSQIDIQLVCDNENKLDGLIVQMTVRAGTKNPFLIYFSKTNKEGQTSITAIDFKDQVDFQITMGIMDYNGSIETASQVVNIDLGLPYRKELLEDKRFLESIRKGYLQGYERLKWSSSAEMVSYYLSSRNNEFITKPQSVELRPNEIIQFVTHKNTT
jgi:hypothetical protein